MDKFLAYIRAGFLILALIVLVILGEAEWGLILISPIAIYYWLQKGKEYGEEDKWDRSIQKRELEEWTKVNLIKGLPIAEALELAKTRFHHEASVRGLNPTKGLIKVHDLFRGNFSLRIQESQGKVHSVKVFVTDSKAQFGEEPVSAREGTFFTIEGNLVSLSELIPIGMSQSDVLEQLDTYCDLDSKRPDPKNFDKEVYTFRMKESTTNLFGIIFDKETVVGYD